MLARYFGQFASLQNISRPMADATSLKDHWKSSLPLCHRLIGSAALAFGENKDYSSYRAFLCQTGPKTCPVLNATGRFSRSQGEEANCAHRDFCSPALVAKLATDGILMIEGHREEDHQNKVGSLHSYIPPTNGINR